MQLPELAKPDFVSVLCREDDYQRSSGRGSHSGVGQQAGCRGKIWQIYINEQISLGKVNSAFMLNLFHIPELVLWHCLTTGNNSFDFSCGFFLSLPTFFQCHE